MFCPLSILYQTSFFSKKFQETSITILTPKLCHSLFHLRRLKAQERELELGENKSERAGGERPEGGKDEVGDDDDEGFDPRTELCAGSLQRRPLDPDRVRELIFDRGTGKFSNFEEERQEQSSRRRRHHLAGGPLPPPPSGGDDRGTRCEFARNNAARAS